MKEADLQSVRYVLSYRLQRADIAHRGVFAARIERLFCIQDDYSRGPPPSWVDSISTLRP